MPVPTKTLNERDTELERLIVNDVPDILPDISNVPFGTVDRKPVEKAEAIARLAQPIGRIEHAVDALPRIVAELLDERPPKA